MTTKQIIAVVTILALITAATSLRSVMRRRDAVKVVRTVLTHWKNGDLTLAMPYWKVPKDSPPVYELMASTMGKGKVVKKDGTYLAHVSAMLEFPPGHPFPSGEQWSFYLTKTRYGWKITDFVLSENDPSR